MMKIRMGYTGRDEEIALLRRKDRGDFSDVNRIITPDRISEMMRRIGKIRAEDPILKYIYI